jgi:multimeric flavodoxin WrbA
MAADFLRKDDAMKIVIVMGSPHGMKGPTGGLLQPLIDVTRAAGAEIQIILLSERNVLPCMACDCCHRTGTCSRKDDFEAIRQAIEAADGLVLATPNYIMSVTAQMKAFLDRCCGPLHLQSFAGKYGAAVVTSGGPGSEEVEAYLLRVLTNLGMWTVGSVGAHARELADPSPVSSPRVEAAQLGRRLIEAITGRKTFPDQEPARQAFYERMHLLVAARQADWPFEYEYWKSHGRL